MEIPNKQRGYVMTPERGLVYREDLPVPEAREGYLLLKIMGASVCGTDIQILKKDSWARENVFPHIGSGQILGHEFFGMVVKTGKGSRVKTGAIGASESHYPCPECMKKGMDGNACPHYGIFGVWGTKNHDGTREKALGGAFSEYILIPEINFYDTGRFYKRFHSSLIEPSGNAWMIMEDLAKRGLPGRMLIFGSGPHGLNLQAFASNFGVGEIVAVEPNDFRRGFSAGMGAAHRSLKSPEASGLSGGFDVVVDMVGAKPVIDAVIQGDLVRQDGIVGLFGLPKEQKRTIDTDSGAVDMNRFIFERMEARGRTVSGKPFTYVGYTGRTDHALRSLIAALEDRKSGIRLGTMLQRQLRIAGPLNVLKDMIQDGFPSDMSQDELKIGFTAFV